ncbi:hypothetical protein FRX31_016209 [Thalictrum thalictroides]|uniref:RING-type domain-containing protein n=1 Tax=Thalictrum thalictroides TaxID=46969 RepID=A0A7J6WCV3_THATH|nr:hypothetical protein FRX31_016209 [Thalictrum thalictroides]
MLMLTSISMANISSPPSLSPTAPPHIIPEYGYILIMYTCMVFCLMYVAMCIHYCVQSRIVLDQIAKRNEEALRQRRERSRRSQISSQTLQQIPVNQDRPSGAYRPSEHIIKIPSECVICLDGFREGVEIEAVAECRHVFHSTCISQWRTSNSRQTCPLCRTAI